MSPFPRSVHATAREVYDQCERTYQSAGEALYEQVAGIVIAHMYHHPLRRDEVIAFIHEVAEALTGAGAPATPAPRQEATTPHLSVVGAPQAPRPTDRTPDQPAWMPEGTHGPQRPPSAPAVPVAQSHTYDYVVCLEDGRKMQMISRHLRNKYGMTPEQYRRKWGLPDDYPMASQKYRDRRRYVAKRAGFQSLST